VAEKAVLSANGSTSSCGVLLRTCVVAPHQIYGADDALFLPSFLNNASRLRVFGAGDTCVSFCHVDNVCHALVLAARSLLAPNPSERRAAGQFYFVTDDGAYNFWDLIDSAVQQLGTMRPQHATCSLRERMAVPLPLLFIVAYLGTVYTWITGRFVKLQPFAVRMTSINRYFCIGKIKAHLGYKPMVSTPDGWPQVVQSIVDRLFPADGETKHRNTK
jgi:nucleoside-diphosphate-sugar epimerase